MPEATAAQHRDSHPPGLTCVPTLSPAQGQGSDQAPGLRAGGSAPLPFPRDCGSSTWWPKVSVGLPSGLRPVMSNQALPSTGGDLVGVRLEVGWPSPRDRP